MQVVILCSPEQKSELMSATAEPAAEVIWTDELEQFRDYPRSSCFVDLLFQNKPERISFLSALAPACVVVCSVPDTCAQLNASFVRVNGWNTFLSSHIIEAACLDEASKAEAEKAFELLGKTLEWIPDIPGFVTPRIISAIINEAFYALEDGVSTKEEIDVAMKLGTAYPYGPLEWGTKIGLDKIAALLQHLAASQSRYMPCRLLLAEASSAS